MIVVKRINFLIDSHDIHLKQSNHKQEDIPSTNKLRGLVHEIKEIDKCAIKEQPCTRLIYTEQKCQRVDALV